MFLKDGIRNPSWPTRITCRSLNRYTSIGRVLPGRNAHAEEGAKDADQLMHHEHEED